MEKLVKGTVVVVPFPYSDLSNYKKRPAVILANLQGDDYIVGQITSIADLDKYSISLNKTDFDNGSLNQDSIIRANKVFTLDKSLVLYSPGKISDKKLNEVYSMLDQIFKE